MKKSWMERYSGKNRETIDFLRFHRYENIENSKSLCHELIDVGSSLQDPALIGFAYCYLAEFEYFALQFQSCLDFAKISLAYLKRSDAPIMLGNCYTLFGCVYMQSYSYELAVQYFLKGLEVAKKYHSIVSAGMIQLNLASVFMILEE